MQIAYSLIIFLRLVHLNTHIFLLFSLVYNVLLGFKGAQ